MGRELIDKTKNLNDFRRVFQLKKDFLSQKKYTKLGAQPTGFGNNVPPLWDRNFGSSSQPNVLAMRIVFHKCKMIPLSPF